MNNRNLSRRKFIQNASLAALGSTSGLALMNGCRGINHYNPKEDGGCAVALGYDVDMPYGGNDYLYDKNLPWKGKDGRDAHGHLNDDIRKYVEKLVTIAETFNAKLQFFIQGNTF